MWSGWKQEANTIRTIAKEDKVDAAISDGDMEHNFWVAEASLG